MASEFSFDVVSKIDQQELDNALNQTRKEIEGRFDFKNSKTKIDSDAKTITILSDDQLKMRNVIDILQAKAIKRGIDIRAFEVGTLEPAAGDTVRQVIALKIGLPKDKSKELTEKIRGLKLKVTTQIQDEQIRVTSKSKDDLQLVMDTLRKMDFDFPLQFVNYR
ncbi:MAG TPA: YajQ family cyclic di-GMP-binding protein [Verrucomicrobiae bacterium]|nr:YajQ family cyclic di-GMP-binding protein [Verrucomicrobiae bacterium]